jgi:hypothetical protein
LIFNAITATAVEPGGGVTPDQNVCLSGKTGSDWPAVNMALLIEADKAPPELAARSTLLS